MLLLLLLQARALNGLDPEETMAVVISKTFTTAETMLNARTVRSWLTSQLGEGGQRLQSVCGGGVCFFGGGPGPKRRTCTQRNLVTLSSILLGYFGYLA